MSRRQAPAADMKIMEFGWVLRTSCGVWFRNLLPFLAIAIPIYAPAMLLDALLAVRFEEIEHPGPGASVDHPGPTYLLMFGSLVLSIVLSSMLTAVVTFGVFEQILGRRPSIRKCLSMAMSRLFPVIGLSLVLGLAVVLGAIACLVPGILLACIWFVAVPVIVVERVTLGEALSRSQLLTNGNRWYVLALLLITILIGLACGYLGQFLPGLADPTTTAGLVGAAIFRELIGLPAFLLSAVLMTVTYFELRRVREGFGFEELAAVFD